MDGYFYNLVDSYDKISLAIHLLHNIEQNNNKKCFSIYFYEFFDVTISGRENTFARIFLPEFPALVLRKPNHFGYSRGSEPFTLTSFVVTTWIY